MHVHVVSSEGEAKFWIQPGIELAYNYGFNQREIGELIEIIKDHENEIREAWTRYF